MAMSNTNDNYLGVLLEEIREQQKAVLEAVGDMRRQVARLPKIEESVDELKQDMKVVKAAVTDLSRQVSDHEIRIIQLETA
jgi:hypothetical protein